MSSTFVRRKLTLRRMLYCALLALLATPQLCVSGPRNPQREHVVAASRPDLNVEGQFALAVKMVEGAQWREAEEQLRLVRTFYADSVYAKEALYHLGVVYFSLGQYHVANRNFSDYLSEQRMPEHFLDVIDYKFRIAEAFRLGRRRPLWGSSNLPKWSSGSLEAIEIYDEIATCLPSHDIAAQALYNKALLLGKIYRYLEGIEAFQDIVMRFPGHPLVADSYVGIADYYCKQAALQSHDPDLLSLARVSLRRFRQECPFDERVEEAERSLAQMCEVLAQGLCEVARFWEKKKKLRATQIYYQAVISSYPGTDAAKRAQEWLARAGLDSAPAQISAS